MRFLGRGDQGGSPSLPYPAPLSAVLGTLRGPGLGLPLLSASPSPHRTALRSTEAPQAPRPYMVTESQAWGEGVPENLSVPLEGDRDFGELCGSHQGCQVPFRPPIPNVGLLLRRCSGKGLHLAMTGEPRGFSRVTAGFSSYDGEFRLPLVLAQASPIFHSSCEGKLGIALE